jgi:hypothetical protein
MGRWMLRSYILTVRRVGRLERCFHAEKSSRGQRRFTSHLQERMISDSRDSSCDVCTAGVRIDKFSRRGQQIAMDPKSERRTDRAQRRSAGDRKRCKRLVSLELIQSSARSFGNTHISTRSTVRRWKYSSSHVREIERTRAA